MPCSAFFGGRAMAQRTLPGMRSVEVKANMVDGFYTGTARDCGYSFGVCITPYSKAITPMNGLSAENISRPTSPTARKVESRWLNLRAKPDIIYTFTATTHSSFTYMAVSRHLPDMRRSTGVRRCCLTEQRSTTRTHSSMVEQSKFRQISASQIELH